MKETIYITMRGDKQGLISHQCCSIDNSNKIIEPCHIDKILAFSVDLNFSKSTGTQSVTIEKYVDPSTPLLLTAISENERLDCIIEIFHPGQTDEQKINISYHLVDAYLTRIDLVSDVANEDSLAHEKITMTFSSIT